jgi:acyl-coenzyme A synthetase/AMP-(fatty) acid ligase
METIEKHRATFTAAPDFAYRMCNSFLKHPEEYDLSSLRIAMNAAEPVRAQTAHKFEENFGLKNIMMPAYGLAEVTCGVSMWPAGTPLKIDERKFVSFGAGFPGITIKILSNGRLVGPHVIGEIIVDSPANSRGYFNNEADTSLLFWNKKFIRTGDLGYCDEDGDFFIVGREKNIIIQQGRNISPHEIEEVIDSLRFVRYSAAVGIDQGHLQGEQAYVFAEVRTRKNTHIDKLQAMTKSMVKAIHSELGFRPGRIYLVRPHAIARTHNGKIKHAALKQDYSEGRLRKEGLILFPDY